MCSLAAAWVGLEVGSWQGLNWAGLVSQMQECGASCLLIDSLGENSVADSSFMGMLPALTSMADSMGGGTGAIGALGIYTYQGKGRACGGEMALGRGRIVLCAEQPGVFMAC